MLVLGTRPYDKVLSKCPAALTLLPVGGINVRLHPFTHVSVLLLTAVSVPQHLPRRMVANDAADLAARSGVAAAAGSASNMVRVPKETKEWAECGWWRCEGPQPQLIPGDMA